MVEAVRKIVSRSGVVIPKGGKWWLSHHYGFDKFHVWGAAIYEWINMEYAKKILVMLPKQTHPMHHHKKKAETFLVLWGSMFVTRIPAWAEEKQVIRLGVGESIHLNVADRHEFYSPWGAVFEELSTREYPGDSYYDDTGINERNEDRKTFIP